MQGNRRRDTKPERLIRSELHRRGFRFRVDLPIRVQRGVVRPDVVFTSKKLAVFIDGCYWHACPTHLRPSRSNVEYWSSKLARNVERDRANDEALLNAGWRVVRIWSHETIEEAVRLIDTALSSPGVKMISPMQTA
jgi:DNA mismatch endonuclease (patch repair protein)